MCVSVVSGCLPICLSVCVISTRISCRATHCSAANVWHICDRAKMTTLRVDTRQSSLSATSAASNVPHLHLAPPLGRPRLIFVEIFGIKKLESLAIVWRCLRDPTFSCFSRTLDLWETDRRTDTRQQLIPALARVARVKTKCRNFTKFSVHVICHITPYLTLCSLIQINRTHRMQTPGCHVYDCLNQSIKHLSIRR